MNKQCYMNNLNIINYKYNNCIINYDLTSKNSK